MSANSPESGLYDEEDDSGADMTTNRTLIHTATRILTGRSIFTRGARRIVGAGAVVLVLFAVGFFLLSGRTLPSLQMGDAPVLPGPAAPAVPTADAGTPAAPRTPEADHALAQLEQLTIAPPQQIAYDRNAFGQRWADVDRNGCDTRNDVLRRDLVDTTTKPGTHDCVVLTGTLHDPYTGTTISYLRGQGTSERVQIDHIVPLAWAARNGADQWTPERRVQFANDGVNLAAVDGPANQSKSDSGPALWMPPNSGYRCSYAIRFVQVLATYELTVPVDDANALHTTLTSCSTNEGN
jgi:hypothetical protein